MSKSTCDWVTHQLWWSARSSLCERKNIAWMWHWPRTRPPLSTTSAAHRKHVHINDLYYHMCMYINLDTYKLQINMLYIYAAVYWTHELTLQFYRELLQIPPPTMTSFGASVPDFKREPFKKYRNWHTLFYPPAIGKISPLLKIVTLGNFSMEMLINQNK